MAIANHKRASDVRKGGSAAGGTWRTQRKSRRKQRGGQGQGIKKSEGGREEEKDRN